MKLKLNNKNNQHINQNYHFQWYTYPNTVRQHLRALISSARASSLSECSTVSQTSPKSSVFVRPCPELMIALSCSLTELGGFSAGDAWRVHGSGWLCACLREEDGWLDAGKPSDSGGRRESEKERVARVTTGKHKGSQGDCFVGSAPCDGQQLGKRPQVVHWACGCFYCSFQIQNNQAAFKELRVAVTDRQEMKKQHQHLPFPC